MKWQCVLPDISPYTTLMQCLAVTGKIIAGFALFAQVEFGGLLSYCDPCTSYPIFRILLEACRAVGGSDGASRVQSVMDRLGLFCLPPVATACVQGL